MERSIAIGLGRPQSVGVCLSGQIKQLIFSGRNKGGIPGRNAAALHIMRWGGEVMGKPNELDIADEEGASVYKDQTEIRLRLTKWLVENNINVPAFKRN